MGTLSRGALRVYAYLRTWCTALPGNGSEWCPVAVRRMAHDLGWTDRYVRRGLAELVAGGLIERRAQFAEQTDSGWWGRSQQVNLWRVLPEPGFPADALPEPKKRSSDPLVQAIEDALGELLPQVPTWAEEEAARADEEAEWARQEIARVPTFGEDDPGLRVTDADRERREEILRTLLAEQERIAADAREAAALPPAQAAARPSWREALEAQILTRVMPRFHMRKREAPRLVHHAVTHAVTKGGSTTD